MTDIVELDDILSSLDRLASFERVSYLEGRAAALIRKQVAALASRDREIDRLRAALSPFVDWIARNDANYATAGYGDACALTYCPDGNKGAPTVGDLRRARAAYEQKGDQG